MKTWLILLGGLIVWTGHFFGLYALAEIAPAPWRVVVLTLACLIADLWLLVYVRRLPEDDGFSVWRRSVATGGAALSLLAVTWQTLPVLT